MVTDQQVRRLMTALDNHDTLAVAAAKAGMSENTARKWRDAAKLPGQARTPHTWRTRQDPFADVWPQIVIQLRQSPRLQAKTLFDDLQRRFPGRFPDGQLRTLQRKIKSWRALEGPGKEVFFPQVHHPGELCASDFTRLSSLGVTIARQPFPHLLYHFVLTYSNWETGTICFSESFESLSIGLQNALFELGGVPEQHRTDRLSAAVCLLKRGVAGKEAAFTAAYDALLRHYGLVGQKIQTGRANENGDVEQRHYRFQTALDQALLLRGSRDFESREAYDAFLRQLFAQLNQGRLARFEEERALLCSLPAAPLPCWQRLVVRVGPSSTIRVKSRVYSVPSRLIGEKVEVRLSMETVEIWYAQQLVESLPRMQGRQKHCISYRHIIDGLVRKPGAFENYRYREDLFPTSYFRMAYDRLKETYPQIAAPTIQNAVNASDLEGRTRKSHRATKEYLQILELAAKESEVRVDAALRLLLSRGETISFAAVTEILNSEQVVPAPTEVNVAPVNLSVYDSLLNLSGKDRGNV